MYFFADTESELSQATYGTDATEERNEDQKNSL
jgi:hypothetical protein